jgi:hypothetical protein
MSNHPSISDRNLDWPWWTHLGTWTQYSCFFGGREVMFLLEYDSYMGASLWYFHIYMYCTLIWIIPSIILLFPPIPFLKWLWQVLVSHIVECIEITSHKITLLYTSLLSSILPLPWPVLHSCLSLFNCLLIV